MTWLPRIDQFCRALACALLFCVLAPAAAQPAQKELVLDDNAGRIEAWPYVTVLYDDARKLDVAAVLASSRFEAPRSARATLGVDHKAVWLRIPVTVAGESDGQWILDIDYAIINRIDVFAIEGGTVRQQALLGNQHRPDWASSVGGRTPAVALRLPAGGSYELLLRVENRGPLILPIGLSKPAAFHAMSLAEQMLQGLLLGLALCLLLYSIGKWIILGESLFGRYALLVGGTTLFSIEFFGLGALYLWKDNAWMTHHAGGLFALMASCGAYLFVEKALARPGFDRTFSLLMKTGAVLTLVSAAAYALDLLRVDQLVAIVSTLGLMPMLLGLPGAFMRARRGDAVGVYFLVGWVVSFMSSVILSQVIGGRIEANFWTMHALQFGNTFDMLVFMRILGMRGKAMQSAMLRAEAATRTKTDFLASMSHEIRTPMNAIIGMSRLALMADPSARQRNYLTKIQGAGEHLLGIINDILDVSKIEAGKLSLEKVPFDLAGMIDQVSSVAMLKADARQVQLVFRVDRAVPHMLVGDPLRLGQVLINLASNAVKFTERGDVVVGVKVVERAGDAVTLKFSVSDTGIGMDEEQLSRLFQSFSQADGSITRKYGGTGLGLSISKQLVEKMGGTIKVLSTPGVGSRFSFTVSLGVAADDAVPAAVQAQQRAEPDLRDADLSRLDGARILLVEDNANNREVALDFLAAAPVTVDVATHGGEAVRMVGEGDYDLVLMDIAMPEVDGLAATRQLRALGATLPVVAMTAHAMAGDRENSIAAGMNDHVTKPIDPELLFRSLLKWIDPARLAGRRPAALAVADTESGADVALPAVAGINWDKALSGVDGKHARLHKRLLGFAREYAQVPHAVRAALAAERYSQIQGMVHNLKSSAFYIGAESLSAQASEVEQALREGRHDEASGFAHGMVEMLDTVLAGLAKIEAPQHAGAAAPHDADRLVRRLGALLMSDDAQAEDVLGELESVLAHAGHGAILADVRTAVEEIEYDAALSALARLAGAMNVSLPESV